MSERALVGNTDDEGQVRSAQRKERLIRQQELADLRTVLSTGEGERFVRRVLAYCGLLREDFNPEPMYLAHASGIRNVGRFLVDEITQADPASLVRVLITPPDDDPVSEDVNNG